MHTPNNSSHTTLHKLQYGRQSTDGLAGMEAKYGQTVVMIARLVGRVHRSCEPSYLHQYGARGIPDHWKVPPTYPPILVQA
jgi:hypothetical protein